MSSKKTAKSNKSDLSQSVMSAIKSQDIKIKPKAYFILGSILLGVGVAAALITAVAFLAITIFHIRTSNPGGFLRYGLLGSKVFLRLFPFRALIISLLGIFGGLALLKKYDISYKKNFITISIGVICGLTIVAIMADRVGINDRLQNIKSLKPAYNQKFINKDVVVGEIVSASDSSMIIKHPRKNQEILLHIDENTTIQNQEGFEIGDRIGAVGETIDGEFYAQGIHEGGMRWRQEQTPTPRILPGEVKGVQKHAPIRRFVK